MEDINIKATFANSEKVITLKLSEMIKKLGYLSSENPAIRDIIGDDYIYLYCYFDRINLEILP